jgi:hypothetical protein
MPFVLYGMFRHLANRLRNTPEIMEGPVIGGYTFLVDDETNIVEFAYEEERAGCFRFTVSGSHAWCSSHRA